MAYAPVDAEGLLPVDVDPTKPPTPGGGMGGKPTGCAVASNALMDDRAAATNALCCGRPGVPALRAAGRRADKPRAWHRADILRMQRGFGSSGFPRRDPRVICRETGAGSAGTRCVSRRPERDARQETDRPRRVPSG